MKIICTTRRWGWH